MIDCKITENFFKEKSRMTENCTNCENCLLSSENNFKDMSCEEFQNEYPKDSIAIVQKWSDEHQQKTRKDDLLEKYPNTILNENGIPTFCTNRLGYSEELRCVDCVSCWNRPIDEVKDD